MKISELLNEYHIDLEDVILPRSPNYKMSGKAFVNPVRSVVAMLSQAGDLRAVMAGRNIIVALAMDVDHGILKEILRQILSNEEYTDNQVDFYITVPGKMPEAEEWKTDTNKMSFKNFDVRFYNYQGRGTIEPAVLMRTFGTQNIVTETKVIDIPWNNNKAYINPSKNQIKNLLSKVRDMRACCSGDNIIMADAFVATHSLLQKLFSTYYGENSNWVDLYITQSKMRPRAEEWNAGPPVFRNADFDIRVAKGANKLHAAILMRTFGFKEADLR